MIKILSIRDYEIGSILTRVYPTAIYRGDHSFIGEKMKLIELTDTEIVVNSLCEDYEGIHRLDMSMYEYGWLKYVLVYEPEDKVVPYSRHIGQLRLQYIDIGAKLDSLRWSDEFNQFGDYLMVCRYIESKIYRNLK